MKNRKVGCWLSLIGFALLYMSGQTLCALASDDQGQEKDVLIALLIARKGHLEETIADILYAQSKMELKAFLNTMIEVAKDVPGQTGADWQKYLGGLQKGVNSGQSDAYDKVRELQTAVHSMPDKTTVASNTGMSSGDMMNDPACANVPATSANGSLPPALLGALPMMKSELGDVPSSVQPSAADISSAVAQITSTMQQVGTSGAPSQTQLDTITLSLKKLGINASSSGVSQIIQDVRDPATRDKMIRDSMAKLQAAGYITNEQAAKLMNSAGQGVLSQTSAPYKVNPDRKPYDTGRFAYSPMEGSSSSITGTNTVFDDGSRDITVNVTRPNAAPASITISIDPQGKVHPMGSYDPGALAFVQQLVGGAINATSGIQQNNWSNFSKYFDSSNFKSAAGSPVDNADLGGIQGNNTGVNGGQDKNKQDQIIEALQKLAGFEKSAETLKTWIAGVPDKYKNVLGEIEQMYSKDNTNKGMLVKLYGDLTGIRGSSHQGEAVAQVDTLYSTWRQQNPDSGGGSPPKNSGGMPEKDGGEGMKIPPPHAPEPVVTTVTLKNGATFTITKNGDQISVKGVSSKPGEMMAGITLNASGDAITGYTVASTGPFPGQPGLYVTKGDTFSDIQYDSSGRVTQQHTEHKEKWEQDGKSGYYGPFPPATYKYQYDDQGRVIQEVRDDSTGAGTNATFKTVSTRKYQGDSKMPVEDSARTTYSNGSSSEATYTLKNGVPTKIVFTGPGTVAGKIKTVRVTQYFSGSAGSLPNGSPATGVSYGGQIFSVGGMIQVEEVFDGTDTSGSPSSRDVTKTGDYTGPVPEGVYTQPAQEMDLNGIKFKIQPLGADKAEISATDSKGAAIKDVQYTMSGGKIQIMGYTRETKEKTTDATVPVMQNGRRVWATFYPGQDITKQEKVTNLAYDDSSNVLKQQTDISKVYPNGVTTSEPTQIVDKAADAKAKADTDAKAAAAAKAKADADALAAAAARDVAASALKEAQTTADKAAVTAAADKTAADDAARVAADMRTKFAHADKAAADAKATAVAKAKVVADKLAAYANASNAAREARNKANISQAATANAAFLATATKLSWQVANFIHNNTAAYAAPVRCGQDGTMELSVNGTWCTTGQKYDASKFKMVPGQIVQAKLVSVAGAGNRVEIHISSGTPTGNVDAMAATVSTDSLQPSDKTAAAKYTAALKEAQASADKAAVKAAADKTAADGAAKVVADMQTKDARTKFASELSTAQADANKADADVKGAAVARESAASALKEAQVFADKAAAKAAADKAAADVAAKVVADMRTKFADALPADKAAADKVAADAQANPPLKTSDARMDGKDAPAQVSLKPTDLGRDTIEAPFPKENAVVLEQGVEAKTQNDAALKGRQTKNLEDKVGRLSSEILELQEPLAQTKELSVKEKGFDAAVVTELRQKMERTSESTDKAAVDPKLAELANKAREKFAQDTGKNLDAFAPKSNESSENMVRKLAIASIAQTGAHIDVENYDSGLNAGQPQSYTYAQKDGNGNVLEITCSNIQYGEQKDKDGKALPSSYEETIKDPATGEEIGYAKKTDIQYDKNGKEVSYQELMTRNVKEKNAETGVLEEKEVRTLSVVKPGADGRPDVTKATTVREKKQGAEWGEWKEVDVKGEKSKAVMGALSEINKASVAAEKSGGSSNGAKAAAHKRQAELRVPLEEQLAKLDRLETQMQQDTRDIEKARLQGAAGFKALQGGKVEGQTNQKIEEGEKVKGKD